MSIFDRRTKKWTAMMLPEHVVQLRGLWQEDGKEEQPIIDATALAEVCDRTISTIEFNKELEITCWIIDRVEKVTLIKIYFDEIIVAEIIMSHV